MSAVLQKEVAMKLTLRTLGAAAVAAFLWVGASGAQDLGPGFHKIKDGIYTFAPDQGTTTCSFVVTEEGVVMIDACNSPLHSRNMLAAIKKVTDKPILFPDRHRDPQRSYRQPFCFFAAGEDHQRRGGGSRDEKGIQSQARRDTGGAIAGDARGGEGRENDPAAYRV